MSLEFFQRQQQRMKPDSAGKDHSKKLRLILLACQLQAASLGLGGMTTPLRVTKGSLAEQYYSDGDSETLAGARKMAERDLQLIGRVFGLNGSDETGFFMEATFETPGAFEKMFRHWLEWMNRNSGSRDTVLQMMLEGLVHAIESAFTAEPLSLPGLTSELEKRYGKSNRRDVRGPLKQLFADRVMSNYLPMELISEKPDIYKVDTEADPLLLRLRPRHVVGDNLEDHILLAAPGRIFPVIHGHLPEETEMRVRVERVAEAVQNSELWVDREGGESIPYSLLLEPEKGSFLLQLYHESDGCYQCIPLDQIGSLPSPGGDTYCPEGIPPLLWHRWKSLVNWQVC